MRQWMGTKWGHEHFGQIIVGVIVVTASIGLVGGCLADADASSTPGGGAAVERTGQPAAVEARPDCGGQGGECQDRPGKDPRSRKQTKRQIKKQQRAWNAGKQVAPFMRKASKKDMRTIKRLFQREKRQYHRAARGPGGMKPLLGAFNTWREWRNATTCNNIFNYEQNVTGAWRYRPRYCTDDRASPVPDRSAWDALADMYRRANSIALRCRGRVLDGIVSGGLGGALAGPGGAWAGGTIGGVANGIGCMAGQAFDQITLHRIARARQVD